MISAHNHAKSMHQLEQIMIGQQQHQNQDPEGQPNTSEMIL